LKEEIQLELSAGFFKADNIIEVVPGPLSGMDFDIVASSRVDRVL